MSENSQSESGQSHESDDHDRRFMTREELYALVWQTPMSRLAKQFGLSDVGLRKICTKNNIPTPPLGYWAKVAHGKRVNQPPLPIHSQAKGKRIFLALRPNPPTSPSVAAAQEAALAQEATRSSIVVPAGLPTKLHKFAVITARALRTSKTDSEGFKNARDAAGVSVSIGAKSLHRAICIIDAFVRAAEERGHILAEHSEGVRIVVDGVPFVWRVYEIKDRVPHEPTREEKAAQARYEENRARWPSMYQSQSRTKVYRSWDYRPSGRLAMTLTDGTRYTWNRDGLIGQWRDRKGRRLEEYLDSAMAALAAGAIVIANRLAEEAERERLRVQEIERRQRERARQERAVKRREFILRKADEYRRYEKLVALASFLEGKQYSLSDDLTDLLIHELQTIIEVTEEGFTREALQKEIVQHELYAEDDLVADQTRS